MRFLPPKASVAFIHLSKAFSEVPIVYHYDPKRPIGIETNTSVFAIDRISCRLTLMHVIHKNRDFFTFKIG